MCVYVWFINICIGNKAYSSKFSFTSPLFWKLKAKDFISNSIIVVSISKTMSDQILIHAGHTSRLLRIICSSERRGGFSGVLGGLSTTSSTSDCCRNKISLIMQTNHTHLLWHFVYKGHLCLRIWPTLEVRFLYFLTLIHRFTFRSVLCFSYFRSTMPRHRHCTNQLRINWGTLSDFGILYSTFKRTL